MSGVSSLLTSASSALSLPLRSFLTGLSAAVLSCAPARPAAIASAPLPPREALDSLFTAYFDEGNTPGLAVGVVSRGGLVWSRSFGVRDLATRAPVDEDTVFRVGSITKTFTGLAVLALRDQGKLALDAPAEQYLPELKGLVYPTDDSARITLRNLVTHTSGLSRDGALPRLREGGHNPTEAELLASLEGQRLDFAPGSSSAYSNQAAALTGLVVAHASGVPYADFVATAILAPLGMTSTRYAIDPAWGARLATGYRDTPAAAERWTPAEITTPGPTQAGGHLWSTLRDLGRFVTFELGAWPPRSDADTGPVRRSTVRESQLLAGDQRPDVPLHGVFWFVSKGDGRGTAAPTYIVSHDGEIDGFHAVIVFAPTSGVGVVALANGRDPARLEATVLRALAVALPLSPAPS